MKKTFYILCSLLLAFCNTACNDWLDVRPDTEQKDEDQFSTASGFYDAMNGIYMSMADQDIYGERLTMTNIESLANLWKLEERSSRKEDLYLLKHDYTNTYAQTAIQTIYDKLFNVIVQANMIIKNIDERGDVILDKRVRKTLQGEAYGIRAYCQLDVLRLFGQLPQNATLQVELPYSETTSIYEMPPYYDLNAYVEKLKADITKALGLLKDNDPVFEYSFRELNSSSADVDEAMLYRQSRMNYWAVKALEARMYLYLGQRANAYNSATEVISATLDGSPVMELSGTSDFAAGYTLCPSECLFYLSKYDVMDYSQSFLVGRNSSIGTNSLYITSDMRAELYGGQVVQSHNRYLNCWYDQARDSYGTKQITTTKYYWDAENVSNPMLYHALIPMLRMSEVYLIAMESTDKLDEANSLYKAYMMSHDVPNMSDFESIDQVKAFMLEEYRREFFAEGQAFYTYKRNNSPSMLWREATVNESEYILPLPKTEYNPNH